MQRESGFDPGPPCQARLEALSISRSLYDWLRALGPDCAGATLLGIHQQACNLVTAQGRVIALVAPSLGDGPLNLVVAGLEQHLPQIKRHDPASLRCHAVKIGNLTIQLEGAAAWEPKPDWDQLRPQRDPIRQRLLATRPWVEDKARRMRDGPLRWILTDLPPASTLAERFVAAFRPAVAALRSGWKGELEGVSRGTFGLAGLGIGLTPAGDDFLAGTVLWAWLAHPDPGGYGHAVIDGAAPRTSTLSTAWLRSASVGEFSANWHHLLTALVRDQEVGPAIERILSTGATSGADMLAGLLWAALDI